MQSPPCLLLPKPAAFTLTARQGLNLVIPTWLRPRPSKLEVPQVVPIGEPRFRSFCNVSVSTDYLGILLKRQILTPWPERGPRV